MNFFSDKSDAYSAALELAEKGFPVFPMYFVPEINGKGTKKPLTPHGYCDASTDPSVIRKWWQQHPDALIGVTTGCASRLFVVDIDSEEANNIWHEFAKKLDFCPEDTAYEKTPHGYHYYYWYPSDGRRPTLSSNRIGNGIETKGENGSIIISPSIYKKDGKECRYEIIKNCPLIDLPDKFYEFVQNLPAVEDDRSDPESNFKLFEGTTSEFGKKELEAACSEVRNAMQGNRHNTFVGVTRRIFSGNNEINCIEARNILKHVGLEVGLGEKEIDDIFAWTFNRVPGREDEKKNNAEKREEGKYDIPVKKEPPKPKKRLLMSDEDFDPDLFNNLDGTEEADDQEYLCNTNKDEKPENSGKDKDEKPEKKHADSKNKKNAEKPAKNEEKLDQILVRVPTLPIEHLPEKVQKIIRNVADVYNTDYWMPFAAILKNVASIVGANTVLKTGPYINPAHQWMMLVCPSASGKSSVTREIFKPIEEMQAVFDTETRVAIEAFEQEMEEWEQAKKDKKKGKNVNPGKKPEMPPAKYLYVNNITMEKLTEILLDNPGGVVWDNDEIATWIQGFNKYKSNNSGSEKSETLSMYEGGIVRTQRVKNGKKVIAVPHAWLSVFGTVQPTILPNLINKDDFSSGFLQRFLFICPEEMPPRKGKHGDVNHDLITDVFAPMLSWKRLEPNKDMTEQKMPDIVRLNDDAEELLDDYIFRMQNETFYLSIGSEESRSYQMSRTKRWSEQCSRLIFALHCLKCSVEKKDRPDPKITLETVRHALAIFDALKEHCCFAWSKIEEMIFEEKPIKKYIQLSKVAIYKHLKGLLTEDGNNIDLNFDFTNDKLQCPENANGTTNCYDILLQRLKINSSDEIMAKFNKKGIEARLRQLGFSKKGQKDKPIYNMSKEELAFYEREFAKPER